MGFLKTIEAKKRLWNSIISKLNLKQLNDLNDFINMDDETLISIKNGDSLINFRDASVLDLVENFSLISISNSFFAFSQKKFIVCWTSY